MKLHYIHVGLSCLLFWVHLLSDHLFVWYCLDDLFSFFGTFLTETQIPKPCTDCCSWHSIDWRICHAFFSFLFPVSDTRDDRLYR